MNQTRAARRETLRWLGVTRTDEALFAAQDAWVRVKFVCKYWNWHYHWWRNRAAARRLKNWPPIHATVVWESVGRRSPRT